MRLAPASLCALALAGQAVAVPFDVSSNKIYVAATVNGHGPFSFILDTGAIAMVVDSDRASSMGIAGAGQIEVHGAGKGALSGSTAHDLDIRVGDATLAKQEAELLPIHRAISASEGRPVDGLLGYPFFSRYMVAIDYSHRQVDFFSGQMPLPPGEEVLPIEIAGRNIFVKAEVIAPDGERISGQFLVDTGWRSAISLSSSFVREHRLNERVRTVTATAGVGIGGAVSAAIGRLAAAQIGSYRIDHPVVDMAQGESGVLSNDNFAGIIGGEVLRRFSVILDYPHRRILLHPNESFGEPYEFDMSGMYLTAGGGDFHAINVLSVTAGSPAVEAGVREGDVIETINDKPAATFGLEQIRQLLRREGTEVSLTVKRDEQAHLLRLKLRRLI